MAVGGWIYHTLAIPSFTNTDDAAWETNVIDPLISLLAGMSGWSVTTAKTKYMSDSGWWFSLTHTSGAELIGNVVGDAVTITTYQHENSTVYHTAGGYTGPQLKNSVYLAYGPPGYSGRGAGGPDASTFMPNDGFGFHRINADAANRILTGTTHRFNFLARGDDLIVTCERDTHLAQTADTLLLLGSCIDPLFHASDSGTFKNEGYMAWREPCVPSFSGATQYLACYKADGTRLYRLGYCLFPTSILSSSVVNAAPWPYVQPFLAMSQSNYDLENDGIVSGSAMKGLISSEWLRVSITTGIADRQRLASGNFVHLTGGAVVGYDPSNGAMS